MRLYLAAAIGIGMAAEAGATQPSLAPVQAQISWIQKLAGDNQRGIAPLYPGVSRGRNFGPLKVRFNPAGPVPRAGMQLKFIATSPSMGGGCFILDRPAPCCDGSLPYGRQTAYATTNAQGEASVAGVRVWGPGTRGSAGCTVTVTAGSQHVRDTTFNLVVE